MGQNSSMGQFIGVSLTLLPTKKKCQWHRRFWLNLLTFRGGDHASATPLEQRSCNITRSLAWVGQNGYPCKESGRRSHDIGINSKRNGLRSWRVELVTRTPAFIHYVILLHKYIELPILYKYFGIFYCESEIKYSENVYSKIMSQGQKRPQNSSDCSICNLDFKIFRGRTPIPVPPRFARQ